MVSTLAKGLNFAPIPKVVLVKKLLCGVGQATQSLGDLQAEECRIETSQIFAAI